MQHVIVQAGGKGSRLKHYCWNKPKCLVPVDGRPMLYQLFDIFKAATFQVIVEYKAEVLARYTSVFKPPVPLSLVHPDGSGTCGGIAQSLEKIPDDEPFWLVWSDLVFYEPLQAPDSTKPVVFLSRTFPCRWSAAPQSDGSHQLSEERSDSNGVMGLFWFPNKSFLNGLAHEGEFVRWLGDNLTDFDVLHCDEVTEVGTLTTLLEYWDSGATTRFFNRITYQGDKVKKEAILPEYEPMIDRELSWYDQVSALGFKNIPQLLNRKPMTLSRIDGTHPYSLQWGVKGRRQVLENITDALGHLHSLGSAPTDASDMHEIYYKKTLARLDKVRRLLPELEEWPSLKVNGISVPNILSKKSDDVLAQATKELTCEKFTVIHGDPTFSNTLIDSDNKPWFFDPRGAFAKPGIMGDPLYDWSKVYYSVVGNYDNFNRRQFVMDQDGQNIEIEIRDCGWSHLKDVFRERFGKDMRGIRIRHALIWLALSGWVDDDYDSILAAYFNGLYHLHDALTS